MANLPNSNCFEQQLLYAKAMTPVAVVESLSLREDKYIVMSSKDGNIQVKISLIARQRCPVTLPSFMKQS